MIRPFDDITKFDDIIQRVQSTDGWYLQNFIVQKDLYIVLLQKFINTLKFTNLEDFRECPESLSYKGIPIIQSDYEGYGIQATVTMYDYYFHI